MPHRASQSLTKEELDCHDCDTHTRYIISSNLPGVAKLRARAVTGHKEAENLSE